MSGPFRIFLIAIVFGLLYPASGPCQAKPDNRYAAESFVILQNDQVFSYKADGTGFRDQTISVKLQSSAAVRTFGVVSVQFASASEHAEFLYARVKHKDGSVTETPVKDAIEQAEQVTREAPFYSDLKQEQLPIKNLQEGDTLEWQTHVVRNRAEAANEFWGQAQFTDKSAVALEEMIELRRPVGSAATVWTNPEPGVKPVESVEGETKVYRWTTAQLAPTSGPEAEAAKKAAKGKPLTAAEQADEDDGKLPAAAWTTFKSWEAVGAWYRGLEGTRMAPDDEVRQKVAELTTGMTTQEETVRAVYNYVSTQIHYIGVAFGVGRFQPHEAVDVLHNQYGDCKDKATLLAAMLGALGLHADSVLIGAEVRFNEAVPSPESFNHLITRVQVGSDEVWLDSTAEVAPYRMLLATLRDKEALVVPEQGPAFLAKTPKDAPFPELSQWTATGDINADGVSDSHISITMRGDEEVIFRSMAHEVPPARYSEFVENVMKELGYSGTISHADMSRPEDTSAPFQMSFDYHRERGDDWNENLRLLPQLEPIGLPIVDEKNPPLAAISLGPPRTAVSSAKMTIPDGWSVQLPEAVHEKCAYAALDLTYRFDKGKITTERKLAVLQAKVPAGDWMIYKKWADASGINFERYIFLHRGEAGQKAKATTVPSEAGSEALSSLYPQLEAAYQRRDEKELEGLLKKMKSIDPKARRYWAWEGALASMKNKPDEAIADNRKEVELYPDETDRWQTIVRLQARKNDNSGAEQTLHQWADAQPKDPTPLFALSALLLRDGRMDDAVNAAKAAVERAPEGSTNGNEARLVLGRTQLKAGQMAAGRATLVALLNSSDDAMTLNNASYELADAGFELPLDDAKSREAVEKLSAETSGWTMDEDPKLLAAKTSLLVASWDTMGWILFREGKFAEARTWLLAARHNSESAEVKGHFGKELSALTNTVVDGKPVVGPDVDKSDQQMRTVALGASHGRVGTGEYRMLMAGGRVEKAVASGDEKLEGAETMLKSADFTAFFPQGSTAKLVRTGMVNCVAGKCEVVLEP
jgi:tetratricopeptide (TPR) repeat protein